MADTLPINIPIPAEQAIASYSFADIVSGTGYIELYAGATIDAKALSSITFYGNPVATGGLLSSTSIDVDFDVVINKTTTIYGTAILSLSESIQLGSDAGNCTFVAYLRYVPVGGSETQIATNTGAVFNGTISNTAYRSECFDLPITSKIILKKGDILRLTITGSGSTGGSPASNRNFQIYHDPANRTVGTAQYTSLNLLLPIRIDL